MSSSPVRALLFGATGNVGKHLLNELSKPIYKQKIQTTVVTRNATLHTKDQPLQQQIAQWQDNGIGFIEADLAADSEDTLLQKITHTNLQQDSTSRHPTYDVLISLVGSSQKRDGQLKLINLCKNAKIPHIIPSEIGYRYEVIGRNSPATWFDTNIDIRDAIREAELQYTFVETGFLTEYVLSASTGIDLDQKIISAPGSLENKITFTCLDDTAVYLANMLLQRQSVINKEVLIYSQTASYNEVADILDEFYSTKFQRESRSMEELKKEKEQASKDKAGTYGFQLVIASQHGTYWTPEESWNYQHLKDYKPTDLLTWLKQNKSSK